MKNLTEHFTEDEFQLPFNNQAVTAAARILCFELLEPIRAQFGKPFIITSAYRNWEHNKAVGGEPTSFHLYEDGKAAADFDIPGIPIEEVFDWICKESKLNFDKVILETRNNIPDVIHIQLDVNAKPRRLAYTGSIQGMLNGRKYESVEVA